MKNSYLLNTEKMPHIYSVVSDFDKKEIDNPDEYATARINYLCRLNKIIAIIKKEFPDPRGVKIADLGCAQSNLSLLLAEKGYEVYAVDLRVDYLKYSRLKHEKGAITWICGNVNNVHSYIKNRYFDVVIMGELIEHCAYPERIINSAFHLVNNNGILLITTPNGSYFKNKLPNFKSIKDRSIFESKQFGPDGVDHLFLFEKSDIRYLLPDKSLVSRSGYIGNSVIKVNKPLLRKVIKARLLFLIINMLEILWPVNRLFSHGIYWVIKREQSNREPLST